MGVVKPRWNVEIRESQSHCTIAQRLPVAVGIGSCSTAPRVLPNAHYPTSSPARPKCVLPASVESDYSATARARQQGSVRA